MTHKNGKSTYYYNRHGDTTKYESKDGDYSYKVKYKNTYKGGYLKEKIYYYYDKETKKYVKSSKTTYTWTSKKYNLG